MIFVSNIFFFIVFSTLVYYYFTNFSFFLTRVFPFGVFFGNYLSIGTTGIHVAEIFTILFLLKNPFIKKSYNELDVIFVLFFSLSCIVLTYNSTWNFLFFKTILRFLEITIVYFIYSKYSFLIKRQYLLSTFNRILIVILIGSAVNLLFISYFDASAWMKMLISFGYIPKNVEIFGYLDSWSSNNSVQANYLVEHQYGFLLISAFYLSSVRKSYLITLFTFFFLYIATQSSTIQISFLVSYLYFITSNNTHKTVLYLLLFVVSLVGIIEYFEELSYIVEQVIYLFQYGKIVEISSGLLRLNYIIEGFSHPLFNWLTGFGLNILEFDIHPHEILTYFYLIYGLPSTFLFLFIFYNRFKKTYSSDLTMYLMKSYFMFALIASFGVNYFTSIVTFFPFILFLTYSEFDCD